MKRVFQHHVFIDIHKTIIGLRKGAIKFCYLFLYLKQFVRLVLGEKVARKHVSVKMMACVIM